MAALVAAIVACLPFGPACAQWSFTVDPTFQTQVVQQNVNALVILSDGKILASGRIRYSGDQSDRGSSRLLPNGSRDLTFTDFVGGGKLTAWSDQYYVQAGLPRRLFSDGTADPSFRSPNIPPCRYFNSVQGGDYHVYPDGRVLISGNHQLWDSIRGYVGRHQLIWLTNEGCLDTTRVHRTGGNCAVYRFKELPNGQFICSGTCNQFDGQEVDWIFRVNADGSVDTTFRTGVYIGEAFGYLPLDDGRVYVGGNFRRTEAPNDTLRLVRFLPDGALDPTFSIPQFTAGEGLSTPFGATAYTINAWRNGTLIITGHFKRVNGQVRKGICMIDSTGQLLPAFSGQGVGPFTFSGLTAGSIHRIVFTADSTQMYICGAYSGYNDGLTNYPQQRFITRLNVQELTTGVGEQAPPQAALQLWPNPGEGLVRLGYALPGHHGVVQLRIRDAQGRNAHTLQASGEEGQVVWDTRGVAPGVYTVELLSDGQVERTERLIIQR
jgi:uncharacterized delta-60 repeat protein